MGFTGFFFKIQGNDDVILDRRHGGGLSVSSADSSRRIKRQLDSCPRK